MNRLWRKQRKLESKLGDSDERPKWMRMRTYERIWAKIDQIEERKDVACMAGIMRITRRSRMTLAGLRILFQNGTEHVLLHDTTVCRLKRVESNRAMMKIANSLIHAR